MSREILFRGKRDDNGEWVVSDCIMQFHGVKFAPRLWAICDGWVDVIPETVGQYTGLTDKNGKKIFEGDIVKWTYKDDKPYSAKVVFHNGGFCMEVETHNGISYVCLQESDLWEHEVIGNIHDNPELMEVR